MTSSSAPPLFDVVAVAVLPGFNLRLTFENGEVRRFNMVRFLTKDTGIFVPLRQRALFCQAYVANGTVCWPGNVAMDPALLYAQSEPEHPDVDRRIGVAKGCFEHLEDLASPRDAEWDAMPEIGLEAWPTYASDAAAWAVAQATALRHRDVTKLDWDNLAEEILDVAKAEQRELRQRVATLMVSLAKSNLRGNVSGPAEARLVREQRKLVVLQLADTPSLEKCLSDTSWLSRCWSDAVVGLGEAGLPVKGLPEESPWAMDVLLSEGWPLLRKAAAQ